MSQNATVNSNSFPSGRPVVFRNATVLTIDPSLGMIEGGDVLVIDNRIAEGRTTTCRTGECGRDRCVRWDFSCQVWLIHTGICGRQPCVGLVQTGPLQTISCSTILTGKIFRAEDIYAETFWLGLSP